MCSYDEGNIPQYQSKDEELSELMNYYKFAYKRESNYNGTCLFELIDNEEVDNNGNPNIIVRCVRCNSETGNVDVWKNEPPDGIVTCKVTLPYSTFHDVFWGVVGCQALVMGGGAKVHNWKYKEAFAFGCAFDMTTENWKRYYEHQAEEAREAQQVQEQALEDGMSSDCGMETGHIYHNTYCQTGQSEAYQHNGHNISVPIRLKSINDKNECENIGDCSKKKNDEFSLNNLHLGRFGEYLYSLKNNDKMKYAMQSHLSQFMSHCYSYISSFNLEDNYLSVSKISNCNTNNNNSKNRNNSYYSNYSRGDYESTRHLSQIKWQDRRNNLGHNNNNNNNRSIAAMSMNSNRNGNRNDGEAFELRRVNLMLNYTKSDQFARKMDLFVNKHKPIQIICQSMENLYNYGNDKGNVMLDSMLT